MNERQKIYLVSLKAQRDAALKILKDDKYDLYKLDTGGMFADAKEEYDKVIIKIGAIEWFNTLGEE